MTDRPEPERPERDRAERLDRFDNDRPYDRPSDRAGDRAGAPSDESLVRREEELRVGVERVRTGRVRLRKKVVEEQRTITVTVRIEEAEVVEETLDPQPAAGSPATPGASGISGREPSAHPDQRVGEAGHAVDGAVDNDDADDAVELVLYEERPVVTMERVPVERVRLRRVSHSETQQVSGQVQVEDVVLDRDDLSDAPSTGGDLRADPSDRPRGTAETT